MQYLQYPFNFLDSCHIEYDPTAFWEEYDVDARELLSYQRFDLFANLLYIRAYDKQCGLDWALNIYKARTAAITGYKLSEPGNAHKNTFDDFVQSFNNLINSFRVTGFDSSKSIVPIDKNNILIDGAHRVSCAAYFGKTVHVVKIHQNFSKPLTVPYTFFDKQLCGEDTLDAMALEYCRWHHNIHMLFIWPKAFYSVRKSEADKFIEESIRVVYRKSLKLGYNALRNLILEIYHNVPWMGTVENGFKWPNVKADEVYSGNGDIEVILLEEQRGIDAMTALKSKLREIFGIGLFSVHSTDTYEEAYLAANLIFNRNSLHHLELGHPDRFARSWNLLMDFRNGILNSGYNLDDFIVDSSMPLALYGMRESRDLDFLPSEPCSPVFADNEDNHIESHLKYLKYHKESPNELIFNPEKHFVFMGLKVITPSVLKDFKARRATVKDMNDIRLMVPILKSNSSKFVKFKASLGCSLRVWKTNAKRKSEHLIVAVLNTTHLYVPVRAIYRFITKRK